jgi:cell division protein ZapA
MASVEIVVNGRPYKVGCEDGHEERLMRLAAKFDSEVGKLADQVGQIGDLRLFLMAGLVLCDELDEAQNRPKPARPRQKALLAGEDSAEIAEIILRAAERVEALAARAEAAS